MFLRTFKFNYEQQIVPDRILLMNDEIQNIGNGDTLLHEAVKKSKNANDFIQAVRKIGIRDASVMASTVNDDGELPIDLMSVDLPQEDWDGIRSEFYTLMDRYVFDEINKPVDIQAVLEPYRSLGNAELNYNLVVGCHLLNEVRRIKIESGNHPGINNFPEEKKDEISEKVDETRIQLNEAKNANERLAILKSEKSGNCHECNEGVLDILTTKVLPKPVKGELYELEKGDHIIAVIGSKFIENADKNDYKKWPKDTVICDAWAGLVYPAFDIPKMLVDYKSNCFNSRVIHIHSNFNSKYDKLKPVPDSQCSSHVSQGRQVGFFKPEHQSVSIPKNDPGLGVEAEPYFSHKRKQKENLQRSLKRNKL